MQAQFVPILSLLISTFLLMAGAGLAGLLLPVRGALEGWSAYQIGFLGTGYAVAFTFGSIAVPRFVRRAGHVRSFASLAALLAIAVLLHGLIVHPIAWIVIRGITGFALAGSYMVIESWLNERVTNETRGSIFSTYMIVSMGAMMSGQYLLPLTDPGLAAPFMLCAIFFAAAVIPTTMSRQAHPKPLTQVSLDLPALYRNSPAALAGVFAGGITAGAWTNMAPLFAERVGLSTTGIATLLVATMAGGVVSQYPLGRLSDRFDRRLVLAGAALAGSIAALVALMMGSNDPTTLFVIAFALGGVIYPTYSLSVAHANDFADASDFVKVSGGLLIVYGVGTMIGPLLSAALMDTRGPQGIFFAVAVPLGLLCLYTLNRVRQRSALPAAEREDFRNLPLARTQTPATLALDPRAETGEDEGTELPWGQPSPQP